MIQSSQQQLQGAETQLYFLIPVYLAEIYLNKMCNTSLTINTGFTLFRIFQITVVCLFVCRRGLKNIKNNINSLSKSHVLVAWWFVMCGGLLINQGRTNIFEDLNLKQNLFRSQKDHTMHSCICIFFDRYGQCKQMKPEACCG